MKSYRGVRKRTKYTIARRYIDMRDGWDYWWEESDKPNAKAQKAHMQARLKGYDNDPNFKLCKVTFEVLD